MLLIEQFQSIGDNFRQLVSVISYYLPRVSAFMLFFPLFTRGFAGNFIKLSVGTALVLMPAYLSMEVYRASVNPPALGLLTFLSEVTLGGLLGMIIGLPYFAFKAVGALIDVYRGATFAAQASGTDSGEELPTETLFGLLFCAIILAGPGLHAITVHLLNSFLLFPPGTLQADTLGTWLPSLLRLLADHITFAVLISGPILIAILVVEILVEIVSAFAQQLQVYSLQFALRSVFGIFFLIVLLTFAEEDIFRLFQIYSEGLQTLLGGLQ